MFVAAERFISSLINKFGKHPSFNRDGERNWYPHQVCKFLKINNHTHSPFEKSIIVERTMQHIKDRTEIFDDYFPRRNEKCKLKHINSSIKLFVDMDNNEVTKA